MSSDAEGDCSTDSPPDKPKLPREVWLLVAANVVVALGYGVVAPVLPQYARHFGVSISAATFVITAFAVMRLVLAPPAGLLVQRLGERRVYISGLLIVARVHRRVRVRADVLAAAAVPVARRHSGRRCSRCRRSALMIRISPQDARGRVAGLFSSGFLVGSVGGPVLGSLTAGFGLSRAVRDLRRRAAVAAAVVFFSLRAAARWRRPTRKPRPPVSLREVAAPPRLPRRAVVQLRDGVGGVRAADRAGAAVRGRGARPRCRRRRAWRWRRSRSATSSVVIPSGYLSDRIGRRKLLIVGLTAAAVATSLLGFTSSLPVFLATAYVAGAATGIFISPQQAAVADIVGNKARGGTAVATFQMMADVGSIGGSLLVGHDRAAPRRSAGRSCQRRDPVGRGARLGVRPGDPRPAASRAHPGPRRSGPEAGGEVP